MAPPSVPTHPHNKAPTADRLVAGGGFSLDDAQRQNAFARQDTLYIGIADRSARPFVRQRPEGSAFVDARQLVGRHSSRRSAKSVRPSGKSMRKTRGFSLFPSTFPRKTHLSKKRSCVLLAPFADGLTPTAEAQGKNFTSPRRMCAEMRTRSLFFYFCLLSMREKHAIFASKTCFINSAWQKRDRSSPFFVSPPECSPTFHPSL